MVGFWLVGGVVLSFVVVVRIFFNSERIHTYGSIFLHSPPEN